MITLSERLHFILDKKGLSQSEAARLIGISQQSLSYIINNKLNASKMSPKIAEALDINPEWLIFGKGKPEMTTAYELPIIHSPYMLEKYLDGELSEDSTDYTVIDVYLGDQAFAYLIRPTEIVICGLPDFVKEQRDHLTLTNGTVDVTQTHKDAEHSFPIFEWRRRNEKF